MAAAANGNITTIGRGGIDYARNTIYHDNVLAADSRSKLKINYYVVIAVILMANRTCKLYNMHVCLTEHVRKIV